MSAHELIQTIEKLHTLHVHLLQVAKEKTTIIMDGDTDALLYKLKDEQKYVSAIQTIEFQRQQEARTYLGTMDGQPPTISDCIDHANGEEKERLIQLQQDLLKVIIELGDQNDLNQSLIQQSLQFVNVSLSLFQPQPESINYANPNQKSAKAKTSIFDSKA